MLTEDMKLLDQRQKTVIGGKSCGQSVCLLTKGPSVLVPAGVTRMGLNEWLHVQRVCITAEEL